MKNIPYEKVNEIVTMSTDDRVTRFLMGQVILDAEPDNEKDIEILITFLYNIDIYRNPSFASSIFKKIAKSNIISQSEVSRIIHEIMYSNDKVIFYTSFFDAICKLCLAKDLEFDYYQFDRCLFARNMMRNNFGKMKYSSEYFLKHPVPIDVFETWVKNSSGVDDSPFWLAILYAYNGNNEYIDRITSDYYKWSDSSIISRYNACRYAIKNYSLNDSDYNRYQVIIQIKYLFDVLKQFTEQKPMVRYNSHLANILLDKIYLTAATTCSIISTGLTEDIVNDLIQLSLKIGSRKNNSINHHHINMLITICRICKFKIHTSTIMETYEILKEYNEEDNDSHLSYTANNSLKKYFMKMIKLGEDRNGKYMTENMIDYLLKHIGFNQIPVNISDVDMVIKMVFAKNDSNITIYDTISLISMFKYIKGVNCNIPYEFFEVLCKSDLNHGYYFSLSYYIGKVLTSYPKDMIDKDIMFKWLTGTDKNLASIAEAWFYHTMPMFDYTKKWDLLYTPNTPDRDLDITDTVVVSKDGALDSTIFGTIPADAIIRKNTNGTYRTNKFTVTKIHCPIFDDKIAFSKFDHTFCYKVGETIEIKDFDPTNDLGAGIYFDLEDDNKEGNK